VERYVGQFRFIASYAPLSSGEVAAVPKLLGGIREGETLDARSAVLPLVLGFHQGFIGEQDLSPC
jgi:hypothetical protein